MDAAQHGWTQRAVSRESRRPSLAGSGLRWGGGLVFGDRHGRAHRDAHEYTTRVRCCRTRSSGGPHQWETHRPATRAIDRHAGEHGRAIGAATNELESKKAFHRGGRGEHGEGKVWKHADIARRRSQERTNRMSLPCAPKSAIASSIRIRVIASRGLVGSRYRLGRPSRLADFSPGTPSAWLSVSTPGDRAVWFRECFVQHGAGAGTSGRRLVRGETVLLQELASRVG